MVKIELTPEQADALVKYGKRLLTYDNSTVNVYANMEGYGRDNFGFWMTSEQIDPLYKRALDEFQTEQHKETK